MTDAILVLEDGRTFRGESYGAVGTTVGEAVFANCRRYVHRFDGGQPSPFVPSDSAPAPVPDWKRNPWFDGTLPEGDPALDPTRPDAPATPEF